MIPRLKPSLNLPEVGALLQLSSDSVEKFESAFAEMLGTKYAIAFPYGRSALWAFFGALNLSGVEVILPAYTCSVVAHAVVLSGNTPRFVDITLSDYNIDLDALEAAITSKTRAIVATHLFGYPLDVGRLAAIVRRAEALFGHKIWVVQDCAHSFGAEREGVPVHKAGDVALFGLNISKTITSIFGGMLTTENEQLAESLRNFRNTHFRGASFWKGLRRRLYLLATSVAFNQTLYGIVYWLQTSTPFLTSLTDAYHLDEKIHFPPDAHDLMLPVEARVGKLQVKRYSKIIEQRRTTAQFYHETLSKFASEDFVLPPIVDGATYSHYVIRVKDRAQWAGWLAKAKVQVGILIEYSVPELHAYRDLSGEASYPNSSLCSRHMINLPIYPTLSSASREKIIAHVQQWFKEPRP